MSILLYNITFVAQELPLNLPRKVLHILLLYSSARYNMIKSIDKDTFKYDKRDNRWFEVFLDYNNLTTIEAKTFGHFKLIETL